MRSKRVRAEKSGLVGDQSRRRKLLDVEIQRLGFANTKPEWLEVRDFSYFETAVNPVYEISAEFAGDETY